MCLRAAFPGKKRSAAPFVIEQTFARAKPCRKSQGRVLPLSYSLSASFALHELREHFEVILACFTDDIVRSVRNNHQPFRLFGRVE